MVRTKPMGKATRRSGRISGAMRVLREARRPGSPGVGARVAAIPRMIGATLTGRYPGLTRAKLLLLAAGAGYIVSPIDAVPEGLLLLLGTVDDIGLAMWLTAALLVETDNFLAWERSGQGHGQRQGQGPGQAKWVDSERIR